MKKVMFAMLVFSQLLIGLMAFPQEDKSKQDQVSDIMKDTVMVNMIMDYIASNPELRSTMLTRLMQTRPTKDEISKEGPEILVRFKPDVETALIEAMENEIGLKRVKEIKALNIKVYKIISNKSLKEVIAQCEKMPIVVYAEPNQKVGIQN